MGVHSVGYRDVTTETCNRNDDVVDNPDGGHPDQEDFTIGRLKCSIPAGVSPTAGVNRHTVEESDVSSTIPVKPLLFLTFLHMPYAMHFGTPANFLNRA